MDKKKVAETIIDGYHKKYLEDLTVLGELDWDDALPGESEGICVFHKQVFMHEDPKGIKLNMSLIFALGTNDSYLPCFITILQFHDWMGGDASREAMYFILRRMRGTAARIMFEDEVPTLTVDEALLRVSQWVVHDYRYSRREQEKEKEEQDMIDREVDRDLSHGYNK